MAGTTSLITVRSPQCLAHLTTHKHSSRMLTAPASRSLLILSLTTLLGIMNGSSKLSLPHPGARHETATFSAKAREPTENSRQQIGRQCLGALRGVAVMTASGISTCSISANPTSTGTTRRFEQSFATSFASGSISESTDFALTSHMDSSKICHSQISTLQAKFSPLDISIITRTGIEMRCTTSSANGVQFSMKKRRSTTKTS